MKVGAFVPIGTLNANPEFAGAVGPTLEDRGFESLWVAEHVVLFDDYDSEYPYDQSGKFPGAGDSGILEPWTALSFVAATTSRLRLGTGICLVGQRNPVYTAKQVADVDVLSGGRVDFGIGIGWLREEFDVVAMPFDHRGARSDEHIEVMKQLWTEPTSSYEGRYYTLPECRMYPKPTQQPHPPIHVGGESDGALRRTARLGQGWFGFNRQPEDVPEALERLDRALEKEGRTRDEIEITICPYMRGTDPDGIKRYAELGVDRVVVVVLGLDRESLARRADEAGALVDAAAAL